MTVRGLQGNDLTSADESKGARRWSRRQRRHHTKGAVPAIFARGSLLALCLCLEVILALSLVLLAAAPHVAAQTVLWDGGGTLRIPTGHVPRATPGTPPSAQTINMVEWRCSNCGLVINVKQLEWERRTFGSAYRFPHGLRMINGLPFYCYVGECPACGFSASSTSGRPTQPGQQWGASQEIGGALAETVGKGLGGIVHRALSGGGGGAGKVSPPPPVPPSEEFRINPDNQIAQRMLQESQIPAQQAQRELEDSLAGQTRFFGTGSVDPEAAGLTQADRVAPYRAESAMQQLRLSAGLGQRAAESAKLGHFEEASWLADQSGQALQGVWVEAAPGDLPLDQPDVPTSEEVYAKYAAAVQVVQKRFDDARAAELKWYEKNQEVEKAEQILRNCEQVRENVQAQIEAKAGSSQSAEEQARDRELERIAKAAEQKAKEKAQKVQDAAQELEAIFNDLQQDAQDASDKLNNTGLDAKKLDEWQAEFSE